MIDRPTILPEAAADLEDQERYLGERGGIDLVITFAEAARKTFDFLAKNPNIGERYPSRAEDLAGLRVWKIDGFPKHLVFYRPTEDRLEIVRVMHGHRQIDRILG
ncbi:type II toxin-antitoxin system RelE/ParE family toxin [Isosphaeraceae bacterium EP7]